MKRSFGFLTSMFVLAILVFLPGGSPWFYAGRAQALPMIAVNGRNGSVESANWGGYAVSTAPGKVGAAYASWVVPSVACGSNEVSYSAFWVGIDGFTSKTVEQTGTDSDCRSGVASYYAWYEFYPLPSRVISSLTVAPGNVIQASVVYSGSKRLGSSFTVTITDTSTGKSFRTSGTVLGGAQRSSAEFIVESPALCSIRGCSLAKLSDFGTVGFGQDSTGVSTPTNCAATVAGVTGTLGSFGSAVQQITMVSQSNPSNVKATPSSLSADGTSFTAQWVSAGP